MNTKKRSSYRRPLDVQRRKLTEKLDHLESIENCPDCSAPEGETHKHGCEFASCTNCGQFATQCRCGHLELDYWAPYYHLVLVGIMRQEDTMKS